ncbi:MAG: asparagine synthase C-terminal domain-containing protein [Lentisphaerales bacterium]|nr:asparagine synthase C-terminal domain-containing protein [Lentisphaerales bacterium]
MANTGLFGYTSDSDENLMSTMFDTLKHRGDNFDSFSVNGLQLGLMTNSMTTCSYNKEDLFITYSGNLHSHTEEQFLSICKDYRQKGISVFEKLRGAYILLIKEEKQTILLRDPAGERSIFYLIHKGRLYFSIEAKALLKVPGFSAQISSAGLAQYLACSYLPGENSIIKNIKKLKPGHLLRFHNGYGFQEQYFSLNLLPEDETPHTRRIDEFKDLFTRAINCRLPDQPWGVFLSGGLDSSIVATQLRELGHKFKTWTIHFGKEYNHELEFAEQVASRLGTDHENFQISPKGFIPDMHKIIWHLDEPIGDPITVPNYQLARHAAKDVKFIFNGEGGDPLFGGPKNYPLLMNDWYSIKRPKNYREKAYLASYKRAYNEIDQLLLPHIQEEIDEEEDLENLFTPFFKAETPYELNKLMAINTQLKGAQLILPKVERMLGANGLTPLAPLFDRELIEFSFKINPRQKLCKGDEKIILKEAFKGRIPQAVIDRPKSGMRVPVHFWFQKEMKNFARKILDPKEIKKAGIFNSDSIAELMSFDTPQWQTRYGLKLWMVLTFEIWRRVTIEGEKI